MGNEPGFIAQVQQLLGCSRDEFAAIDSVVIDVHTDEFVCK